MINEIVELGRAEDLVEIGLPTEPEEAVEKYEAACAPYLEFAELGHAEDLVEIGLPTEPEEAVEKFESACAPYVEFE